MSLTLIIGAAFMVTLVTGVFAYCAYIACQDIPDDDDWPLSRDGHADKGDFEVKDTAHDEKSDPSVAA